MTYYNAQKYILKAPDESSDSQPGTSLRKVWAALGNPQRNIKYLRLAGSNGKTVSSEMIMSVYKKSEITVGVLTTTLRSDLRCNISIKGEPLSFESISGYVETIYKTVNDINKQNKDNDSQNIILTKQEILLSVALLAFRTASCSFCIIESDHKHTDPTVLLPPPFLVAICGAIPSDNKTDVQMIRSYICHGIDEIVSAPQDQSAYNIISNACAAVNCRLTIPAKSALNIKKLTLSGSEFIYKDNEYKIGLCGKFQIINAIFVLEILERLCKKGYAIPFEQIYEGLKNTKIPARFEILSIMPTIIADSTHSDVAISTVCDSMSDFRDIIGSKIRLCLPEGPIVDKYLNVLEEKNYDTKKIIIASFDGESKTVGDFIYCKKVKELIKAILDDLEKDEILLISGPSAFTLSIRYELLSQLGY